MDTRFLSLSLTVTDCSTFLEKQRDKSDGTNDIGRAAEVLHSLKLPDSCN